VLLCFLGHEANLKIAIGAMSYPPTVDVVVVVSLLIQLNPRAQNVPHEGNCTGDISPS